MAEQEAKELELFIEWFNKVYDIENPNIDFNEYYSAEQAWFARAELDKERNEKENL